MRVVSSSTSKSLRWSKLESQQTPCSFNFNHHHHSILWAFCSLVRKSPCSTVLLFDAAIWMHYPCAPICNCVSVRSSESEALIYLRHYRFRLISLLPLLAPTQLQGVINCSSFPLNSQVLGALLIHFALIWLLGLLGENDHSLGLCGENKGMFIDYSVEVIDFN